MPGTLHFALRNSVEGALAKRFPGALTPQSRDVRPLVSCGVSEVDRLLGGGLPVGAITEVVGTASAGRTSLAMAAAASFHQHDHFAAWVDAGDAFDPESAAAAGVLLERLLWVRCGVSAANPAGVSSAERQRSVRWMVPGQDRPMGGGCNSPHPRSEARGITEAVGGFLHHPASAYRRDRKIGTPGVRNLPLRDHEAYKKEQPNSDRMPARRGEGAGVTHRVSPVHEPKSRLERRKFQTAARPWDRMDQALRAADLLLAAGGFGLLVLDFGGIAPEVVNRIPLATWFRFRAAADSSRTVLLLLTQHSSARSSAEVLVQTRMRMPEEATVLPRLDFEVELLRQRYKPRTNVMSMRKPSQPERETGWSAAPHWAGGR